MNHGRLSRHAFTFVFMLLPSLFFLASCSHYIKDEPLPPDFQAIAKGKLVGVVWLMPKFLSTPGFYNTKGSPLDGEQLKATAMTPPIGGPAITVVRSTYYQKNDLVDIRMGSWSTKAINDKDLKISGKEYVRAFVHTIATNSMTDRWHRTLLPNALKDYGLQVIAVKQYNTEEMIHATFTDKVSGAEDIWKLSNDLIYEFKDMPEVDYAFIIEVMGVGVVASSPEEPSRFSGADPKTVTLSGEAVVYASLLDPKSNKKLWQHLAVPKEPILGENGKPVHYLPGLDGGKDSQIPNETIKAAVEKSFQKAMAEIYISFFQRQPQETQ